jgi:phage/conjugal plasmid C-4 type zinc finger TraR family protein
VANGWASDGAVQQQIDDSIDDAVKRARAELLAGPGRLYCEACEAEIPLKRRQALPGVRRCVACQAELDAEKPSSSPYNRRGNKDSQLR